MQTWWDYTVEVPNYPGSLAKLGEEFGRAKINIEGLACFEWEGQGYCHVLTQQYEESRKVFSRLGWKIRYEYEVLVAPIENRPGILGEYCRRLADAGINVTTCYAATDSRLVFGAADYAKLREVWTSWVPAGSRS